MKIRTLTLAALAAASFGAQAALTTYAPWETAYSGNGLSGVLFNVQSDAGTGATVALGAHAYKNGVFLANDGINTFYASTGTYAGPPAEPNRANWSFDFGWSLGNCTGCSVWIGIDNDASAGVNYVFADITAFPVNPESWNMEMAFIGAAPPNGFGYNFDPFSASSTGFRLEIRRGQDVLVGTDITVNAAPEPASLALAGLALAGAVAVTRRRRRG